MNVNNANGALNDTDKTMPKFGAVVVKKNDNVSTIVKNAGGSACQSTFDEIKNNNKNIKNINVIYENNNLFLDKNTTEAQVLDYIQKGLEEGQTKVNYNFDFDKIENSSQVADELKSMFNDENVSAEEKEAIKELFAGLQKNANLLEEMYTAEDNKELQDEMDYISDLKDAFVLEEVQQKDDTEKTTETKEDVIDYTSADSINTALKEGTIGVDDVYFAAGSGKIDFSNSELINGILSINDADLKSIGQLRADLTENFETNENTVLNDKNTAGDRANALEKALTAKQDIEKISAVLNNPDAKFSPQAENADIDAFNEFASGYDYKFMYQNLISQGIQPDTASTIMDDAQGLINKAFEAYQNIPEATETQKLVLGHHVIESLVSTNKDNIKTDLDIELKQFSGYLKPEEADKIAKEYQEKLSETGDNAFKFQSEEETAKIKESLDDVNKSLLNSMSEQEMNILVETYETAVAQGFKGDMKFWNDNLFETIENTLKNAADDNSSFEYNDGNINKLRSQLGLEKINWNEVER